MEKLAKIILTAGQLVNNDPGVIQLQQGRPISVYFIDAGADELCLAELRMAITLFRDLCLGPRYGGTRLQQSGIELRLDQLAALCGGTEVPCRSLALCARRILLCGIAGF